MGGKPSKNMQVEQTNHPITIQAPQPVTQPSVQPPRQIPKPPPQQASPQQAKPTQVVTNPSPNRNYLESTIQEANQAVYSRAVKTKKKVKSNRRITDAIQTEELKDVRVNYSVNYQRKQESISQHNQSTKIEIEDLD